MLLLAHSAAKPFTDHPLIFNLHAVDHHHHLLSTSPSPACNAANRSPNAPRIPTPLPLPPLVTRASSHRPDPESHHAKRCTVVPAATVPTSSPRRLTLPIPLPIGLGLDTSAAAQRSLTSVSPPNPARSAPYLGDTAALAAGALSPDGYLLQPHFRRLTSGTRRPRKEPAARLWNPSNSTPRPNPALQKDRRRRRRPSTPPPPSVPINHPELSSAADANDTVGTGAPDYPLLTLPQVLHLRNTGSQRNSLPAERRASNDRRVSLPSSVRASYEGTRSQGPTPTRLEFELGRDEGRRSVREDRAEADKGTERITMATNQNEQAGQSYSQDLERGPDVMDPRRSTATMGDGIGSAVSSSNSSIMGEDVHADEEAWGPQHPCYPHLNPHVPLDSPEHTSTRIIRIKRDWMVRGDLAPTFSNLYPEILDPAGLSEQEFRRIIEKLNGELIPIFNPFSLRNVVDGVLGVVTGWLWDDFGLTAAKSRLNKLEKWIEDWNVINKAMGSIEGVTAPKLISLRRTGYMSLDIQIPDPEVAAAPSTSAGPGDSGTALPLESPSPVHAAA
ncbi:Ras modification protein-like protein [Hapsidospora chrysogenum ATCC 11550]|uniref:Ras modification protein ERF4 n=1 Tax=Hapsidospora chrysogenum (strain ATCC 11550 / CBS 779.69 / DSM 880 / IAM 14645 / JCM 23072 / IMI 49137) TaxID=857340 RepID=A0A086THV6_HAPC1|nr:Ras modification protein-like protein [Hapsidospora chrysogenum ATCC 11550]